jgi:hypothetical protein
MRNVPENPRGRDDEKAAYRLVFVSLGAQPAEAT